MPIIKSAKKRVKVAAKARSRNLRTKRTLRDALKAYAAALEGGKPAEIAKTQAAAISALDIAAKKAVIHKNKAARLKSRISTQAKSKGVKPQKTVVAKAPAKKPVAAKKPAKPKT
jgi:small subunit ribosomal protein S20